MRHWTILCDFDGTIAVDDATDTLLKRFAHPDWEIVEADWRAGRLGSRACMSAQIAMIDASRAQIDAVIDGLPIDPAFPAFVAAARRRRMALQVVSDGLDYVVRRMLARYGLDDVPVRANRLLHDNARAWSLDSPYARSNCAAASGTCKCGIALDYGPTLLIGDGRSDFCVAGRADYVFAKHRLIAHCRRLGIPHRAITNFREARALLADLPAPADSEMVSPESYAVGVDIA